MLAGSVVLLLGAALLLAGGENASADYRFYFYLGAVTCAALAGACIGFITGQKRAAHNWLGKSTPSENNDNILEDISSLVKESGGDYLNWFELIISGAVLLVAVMYAHPDWTKPFSLPRGWGGIFVLGLYWIALGCFKRPRSKKPQVLEEESGER